MIGLKAGDTTALGETAMSERGLTLEPRTAAPTASYRHGASPQDLPPPRGSSVSTMPLSDCFRMPPVSTSPFASAWA